MNALMTFLLGLGLGMAGWGLRTSQVVEQARDEAWTEAREAYERKAYPSFHLSDGVVILSEPARDWDLAQGAVVRCEYGCSFAVGVQGGRVYLSGRIEEMAQAAWELQPVSDLLVHQLRPTPEIPFEFEFDLDDGQDDSLR